MNWIQSLYETYENCLSDSGLFTQCAKTPAADLSYYDPSPHRSGDRWAGEFPSGATG